MSGPWLIRFSFTRSTTWIDHYIDDVRDCKAAIAKFAEEEPCFLILIYEVGEVRIDMFIAKIAVFVIPSFPN